MSTGEKFHRVILEYLRVFGGSRLGKVVLNNIREFTMEFHYKLQQWNKEFYRLNRALFEKGVAEGLVRADWDSRQMATAFAGIVIEFGKVHMLGENCCSLEESADFIYDLLFKGLGVPWKSTVAPGKVWETGSEENGDEKKGGAEFWPSPVLSWSCFLPRRRPAARDPLRISLEEAVTMALENRINLGAAAALVAEARSQFTRRRRPPGGQGLP